MSRPTPALRDHLQVAFVLVSTLFGLLPFLAWTLLAPILKPWVKRRFRRCLEQPTPDLDEPPAPDPHEWAGRTVFVVAGEPSGDQLAAHVVAAMKKRCPQVRVRGYAGARTAAAGALLDRDILEHAVFGVLPVIRSLPTWWGILVDILALVREDPPDVFLTVDFPGLNGRLARGARRRGIPAVHLVPPSAWAYAPWRLLRWRRAVSRFLAVFPFEPKVFEGSRIPCTYVGHPSFEAPLAPPRTPTSWPGDQAPWIELLPGSRRQEIHANVPLLLDAAARVEGALPGARFRVRLATAKHEALFASASAGARRRPRTLDVVHGPPSPEDAQPLVGAMACSGTVTAELGAALVPMVIVYRIGWGPRLVASIILTTPWIGLVNLIAGGAVAPEHLQTRSDGAWAARAFLDVAGTAGAWEANRALLAARVRETLETHDVADRAARAVFAAAETPAGPSG